MPPPPLPDSALPSPLTAEPLGLRFVIARAPLGVRGAVCWANVAASRPSVPWRATLLRARWATGGRRRGCDPVLAPNAGLPAEPTTTATPIAAASANLGPDIRLASVREPGDRARTRRRSGSGR